MMIKPEHRLSAAPVSGIGHDKVVHQRQAQVQRGQLVQEGCMHVAARMLQRLNGLLPRGQAHCVLQAVDVRVPEALQQGFKFSSSSPSLATCAASTPAALMPCSCCGTSPASCAGPRQHAILNHAGTPSRVQSCFSWQRCNRP